MNTTEALVAQETVPIQCEHANFGQLIVSRRMRGEITFLPVAFRPQLVALIACLADPASHRS